ncbi:hypothetical protein HanIR_Chr01g0009381 [Helianthus annuus]|nr:hypothetical protein HanIR_Chr01g0009381 [Helianthus annuus]
MAGLAVGATTMGDGGVWFQVSTQFQAGGVGSSSSDLVQVWFKMVRLGSDSRYKTVNGFWFGLVLRFGSAGQRSEISWFGLTRSNPVDSVKLRSTVG